MKWTNKTFVFKVKQTFNKQQVDDMGGYKKQQEPVACQENIRSLFEQVRLGHLMIEAAGWVMEALVSEEVDIDAALGFIYLGNLGKGNGEEVGTW